jgi:orotidine-5'-phosphate decarboxylase
MVSRLLVALDFPSATEAVSMATRLSELVDGFKVGLELLMGPGPAAIAAIRELGKPVLVDAKLYDIPNTVRSSARQLGRLGARWVTVHGAGGGAMLEAAVSGLREGADGRPAGVVAVTVLTSLDQSDLAATGISGTPGKQVARLARLAARSGAEGVVCSVRELGDVAQVAPGLTRITPGIRSEENDAVDQARVGDPAEAVRRGADYLVVGRPITRAADPVAAARRFIATAQGETQVAPTTRDSERLGRDE